MTNIVDVAGVDVFVRLGSFLRFCENVSSSAFGTELVPGCNEEVRDA